MFYRVLRAIISLRDSPSDDANEVAQVLKGEVGEEIAKSPDGAWVQLIFGSTMAETVRGWIRLEEGAVKNLEEVGAPPRPELNIWAFLKGCVQAETWINKQPDIKPFFLNADYLIALANIETGLKNLPNKRPDSDGIGPLQISTKDWKAFIDGPGAKLGFDEDDRDRQLDQIYGAAYLVARTIQAISKGVTESGLIKDDKENPAITGPYIPSYADVLLANITNAQTAIKMRLEQLAGRGSQSVETVFIGFSPEDVKKIVAYRSRFLLDDAQKPETIDGAYARITKALDEEFLAAFNLMKELTPEDLPQTDGKATWIDVAMGEEKNWEQNLKNETTPAGTAKVIEYFKSIGTDTDKVLNWCGAFVGFCLKQKSVKLVDGPAIAANWKQWGNTAIPLGQAEIPTGTVVVLSPGQDSGTSGHVGFFMRFPDKDHVELLGGNQSNTVKLSQFLKSRIVALRWLSPAATEAQDAATNAVNNAPSGKFDTLLDFLGKFESNNNYNAYLGHSGNQTDPQFTAMTVDQVLEWQKNHGGGTAVGKYQFIRKTLRGLLPDKVKGSDLFDKATQDRLAINQLEVRGLGKYLARQISLDDFATNLAMEWASMPVTKDIVRKDDGRLIKTGQSYYAGIGGNQAGAKVADFLAAVRPVG